MRGREQLSTTQPWMSIRMRACWRRSTASWDEERSAAEKVGHEQAAMDGGFASKQNLTDANEGGSCDVCFAKNRGLKVPDKVKSTWVYLPWGIGWMISAPAGCLRAGPLHPARRDLLPPATPGAACSRLACSPWHATRWPEQPRRCGGPPECARAPPRRRTNLPEALPGQPPGSGESRTLCASAHRRNRDVRHCKGRHQNRMPTPLQHTRRSHLPRPCESPQV